MAKLMVREIAYIYLSEAIVSNTIKSGESIIEADIAEALGISRTPVREVLGQLESEGLLVHMPNCGYFVSDITLQDIDEICDLRKMFELYALRYCIANVTDEDIQRMKELLNQIDSDTKIVEYFESERSFHRTITAFCPNKRARAFLKVIDRQEERMRRTLSVIPNRLEKVRDEHMYLLQVLEKRDFNLAAQALEEHLDTVRNSLIYAYKTFYLGRDS